MQKQNKNNLVSKLETHMSQEGTKSIKTSCPDPCAPLVMQNCQNEVKTFTEISVDTCQNTDDLFSTFEMRLNREIQKYQMPQRNSED